MRFTSVVDIRDLKKTWSNFEKRTKYAIRICNQKVYITDAIAKFNYFHRLSRPDRKISFAFIQKTYLDRLPNARIYATDTAMAMFSWTKNTAYYLLAGRDVSISDNSPSKILWQAMIDFNKMEIKKLDLCGFNKPNIILFKRGFGGKKVKQKKPCLCY